MAVQHVFSNAVPDGTNTAIVRPSDWNSYHNQYSTISGNTAGQSTLSGTNIILQAGSNVTLSGNGSTIIINAAGGGGGAGSLNVSAGSTSNNLTAMTFNNANGVSFGLSGSVLTGSVATNYQPAGAYLTTAMQSNASSNFQSTGAYLTTAMQSNAGSNFVGLNSALTGNGVSATINSSGISLNVPAFLTTAMQSNAGSNFIGTSQSSLFQQVSNTSAITSNAFANSATTKFAGTGFTGTNATATINSNGLQLSIANPGGAGTTSYYNQIAAGASTVTSGTVVFSSANGVSFGLNGSTMTASHNGLTTAMQSNAGSNFVGLNSALTGNGVSATINSSGISLNVPAFLTTAMQSNASSNFQSTGAYLTTAMQSNAGSNFVGLNSALTGNGVSATINSSGISLNVPAFLTTAMQSNAGSNFAGTGFTGTNASATLNSNGLQLSVGAGGGGGTTSYYNQIAAGASTVTSGTVVFGNSNGVSFGLNGSTMTASVATNYQSQGAYLTTAMVSNAGSNFVNASGAFNGTNITGTIGSNGLSLSVANPSGGAGVTMSDFFPMQMAASSTTSFAQNTLHFAHIIPNANISMTCVEMMWSLSMSSSAIATWNKGSTLSYGIYSEDPSGTRMNSVATSSMAFIHSASSNVSYGLTLSAGTNSATLSTAASALTAFNQAGYKIVSLPIATSLSAGLYYFGYAMSTSSAGANVAMTHSYIMNNEASGASMGALAPTGLTATNKSIVQEPYGFILSVTTGAMPSTVAYSDISINSNTQPYLYFEA